MAITLPGIVSWYPSLHALKPVRIHKIDALRKVLRVSKIPRCWNGETVVLATNSVPGGGTSW
jgi:hypothetical protein